jgi:trimethylamine:corrinoid methyltransferase-like protein
MRPNSPRSRRPQTGVAAAPAAPADAGLHFGPTGPYEPISAADADRLVDGALRILHESGVVFEAGSEAHALLRAAGALAADDGVVRFEPDMVRSTLQTVAKSVRLWNRPADRHITLDDRHTWFIPGMTCIKVFDLDSGEPRDSNGEDLATLARVADALPNIDAVCVGVKNVARSTIHGEIEEFAILANHTTKPLEYLCERPESLGVVIDMAAQIRGGRQELFDKPYFLQVITPLPRNYPAMASDQIIAAVRAGVPVSVGTLPIGGASSPITTAGCLVQSLATDFAGMVLSQAVRPGSFCVGSSDVNFMEPATGAIGNWAQTCLADMLMCQVRRRLGLPSFTGIGGQSNARRFNQDAVSEICNGMLQAFFTRPATLDYLGTLDMGLTFSLQALLLCDDIAALLRTMWAGVPLDDEAMAVDLAIEVGPKRDYLQQKHTVLNCRRNVWASRYFGANYPMSNTLLPDRDLGERIEADLRRILAEHHPAPLDAAVNARMREIMQRFERSFVE